jgi:capsid protein
MDKETNKKIEELENAIIQYLRPGEEVTFAQNPRPGDNFPPFVRLVLCMLAVTAGVPYELLSGNYEDINYSTARTIRNDFSHQLRPVCRRHVLQFAQPVARDVIAEAWLAGRLSLPGFASDPQRYFRSEWQPPGMESLDPQREGKAHAEAVSSLLRSPQEIVRGRGRELEDVYREIADAKALAEELGLPTAAQMASTAKQPAQTAAQEASS